MLSPMSLIGLKPLCRSETMIGLKPHDRMTPLADMCDDLCDWSSSIWIYYYLLNTFCTLP